MEAAELEEHINAMGHKPLTLTDYANVYSAIHHAGNNEIENYLKSDMVSTILTQYHISKGLKLYGKKGVNAVLQELKQLHDRLVIEPKFANNMTAKQKEYALQYLMFLKEKRGGTIKGRGCADGRKQRVYISKDQASAPTVATESLLLTCLIDAAENRDVATVDVPRAFMQSDMEGPDTHMKLEGKMVEIL